jgi:hypothetical protein
MWRWVVLASVPGLAVTAVATGEVRLAVDEPAGVQRQQWPVTSGIPLAQGALRDDQAAALSDEKGRELPLQTETLARWPDGSIRWLLLDFQIELAAHEKKTLTLRYGPEVRRTPVANPVRVTKQPDGKVVIEPGPVRLIYDPKGFMPQGEAWLTDPGGNKNNDRRVTANSGADGVLLQDATGRDFFASAGLAHIAIEQSGPVRACIRVSGWHETGQTDNQRMFRYVARIHAWRDQPYVRVFYTFINDSQDSLMAKIRKLELRFRRTTGQRSDAGGEPEWETRRFQVDENQDGLNGAPSGGRRGRFPFAAWCAGGDDRVGLAVGLREFWQNWPKALIWSRAGGVGLALCPELPKGLYDGKPLEEENKLYYAFRGGVYTFKVGVAKTHELWIRYFSGSRPVDSQALVARLDPFFNAAEEPLLAVPEPAHTSATKALGDFPPADPEGKKYAGYDAWLSRSLDAHLKLRERNREYGMLNYGDWYGERKVNWGNLEYDLAHGMFVQYLRTGDRRFFLRGEQAARHHIDVDVVHATNPYLKNPWGPPPQVGEIWLHCLNHTGGYYENAPLPVDRTYQMGHSTNFGHVWVGGDLEYYYLTGDRRAREVAIEIADAMTRHCPTAYSDHIRALGWPIVLELNAYEATGERKYLDAATACWQVLKKNIDWKRGWVVRLAKGHCLHPERTCYGNVPFMEGLTTSALARYHRITQDPEVLRAMSVAVDQMIRECWLEDAKVFRYTACPLTGKASDALPLASEGIAYEATLTGNQEHLRVLREGLREVLRRSGSGNGKGLAQLIHFTPYALSALGQETAK